jgi:hypothetical protein
MIDIFGVKCNLPDPPTKLGDYDELISRYKPSRNLRSSSDVLLNRRNSRVKSYMDVVLSLFVHHLNFGTLSLLL